MAYCTNCGKQVPDGAKFCPACGSSVSESMPTSDTPVASMEAAPKKKTKAAVITCVVIIAVIVAGAFAWFSAWNKTDGILTKTEAFSVAKEIVTDRVGKTSTMKFISIKDAIISTDGGYYYVTGWVSLNGSTSYSDRTLWSVGFTPIKGTHGVGYIDELCIIR